LIDLDAIVGKSSEIETTRIAPAKSIKLQMGAQFPDVMQTFHISFVIGDKLGCRNFKGELTRRWPLFPEDFAELACEIRHGAIGCGRLTLALVSL